MFNKLLQRQIQKYIGPTDRIPTEMIPFLKAVNDSYDHYEKDRNLIEHSIDISSNEMIELNKMIRKERDELQKANKEIRMLFENIEEVFFSFDMKELRIIQMSVACEKVYGYTPTEFITNTDLWRELIHTDDQSVIEQANEKLRQGKSITKQYRITHKNRNIRWVETKIKPTLYNNGELVRLDGVTFDITEKKLAEQKIIQSESQIRNFARHLNHVLEEERAHIAREIHDEFGQQLIGIKIGLSSLAKKKREYNPTEEKNLNEIISTIDNTIQLLRKIATELRPGILDTLGLIPSIKWLVTEFEKMTAIKCDLGISVREEQFNKNLSTCFFRICQEALTNISKHAQASKIVVTINQEKERLILKISDNGKGIAGEKLENPLSMGLLGMRERANILNADLQIISKINSGTTIQFSAKTT